MAAVNRKPPALRQNRGLPVGVQVRRRHRRADPTDWLLGVDDRGPGDGTDDPAVRYRTLTDILGRAPRSPAVMAARKAIMTRGVVPAILACQRPDGGWTPPHRLYTSKYWGTVWNLIVLAEFGASPADSRIGRACDHILQHSWSQASGGFATYPARSGGGDERRVIPCLTGNMVFGLVRLGKLNDERVRQAANWLGRHLRFDDGDSEPPAGHRYRHQTACYGRHSCFHGVVKGLKALAEIPARRRSPAVKRCISRGVQFMLRHQVYRSSRNPRSIGRAGWTSFGFPLMWNTDALEILDILTRLGIRDGRMQPAVDLVRRKQDANGRWRLDQSWNGRLLVDIERQGKPSKWVTLRALQVLHRWSGVA